MSHKEITIVSACVDFSDYLVHVIDSWKQFNCKEIIIVTTNDDEDTLSLCEKNNLTIIPIARKEKWVRGYYLNAGLIEVRTKWTLILDSDCWLPNFNIITSRLRKRYLYGLPQAPTTPEKLYDFKENKKETKLKIKHATVGVGFFQLFNTSSRGNRLYNEEVNVMPNGKGASLDFASHWKEIKRLSSNFVVCISNNTNREGRKTNTIPNKIRSKKELIKSKLERFVKFTKSETGIAVYKDN